MNYKDKYIKYKAKYLELKNMDVNNQIGGNYIKRILYENGLFSTQNNIDNDIIDINSTFLIGSYISPYENVGCAYVENPTFSRFLFSFCIRISCL